MVKIHNKAPAPQFNFGTDNELLSLRLKVASKLVDGDKFYDIIYEQQGKFLILCVGDYILCMLKM